MRSPTYSLFLITLFFAIVAIANYGYLSFKPLDHPDDLHKEWMNRTMGSIFVILGLLKLMNLREFAQIFSKYDIVAHRLSVYGYTYPFFEIILGLSFFVKDYREDAYKATIALMTLGLVGVGSTISSSQSLRCGCMGSLFHIPVSYVTVSENLLMIGMSLYLQSQ